jgi:hypothetical protein
VKNTFSIPLAFSHHRLYEIHIIFLYASNSRENNADLSSLEPIDQDNFFPTGTITRAEVGTILSRLLRGTTYASQQGDAAYYVRHLQALKDAGIMRVIAQPEMVELRGNILSMLRENVQ